MQRRDFITLLGGAAAAWPLAAWAQQPAVPVIGYLSVGGLDGSGRFAEPFRKGLSEAGFVEGRNVGIEFRWANNDYSRLPELATDLVRRRVAVIAAMGGAASALAVKAVTTTIPIVFVIGGDPVQTGIVSGLNRPGGNATGIAAMNVELMAKRLGLLHELKPGATHFAILFNPTAPFTEFVLTDLKTAAAAIGGQVEILAASTNREIDSAFASIVQKRVDALIVVPDLLFANRRLQISTLTIRHAVPTIHWQREFPEVGGLMSYGMSVPEQYRLAGIYVGRILRGEQPADLPVMQATRFEFVTNLQTARSLGIEVPATLLAIADAVIE